MNPDSIIVDGREMVLTNATDADLDAAMVTLHTVAARQEWVEHERYRRELDRIRVAYVKAARRIEAEKERRRNEQDGYAARR